MSSARPPHLPVSLPRLATGERLQRLISLLAPSVSPWPAWDQNHDSAKFQSLSVLSSKSLLDNITRSNIPPEEDSTRSTVSRAVRVMCPASRSDLDGVWLLAAVQGSLA